MKKILGATLAVIAIAMVLTGCYSKSCGCPTGSCPMASQQVVK
jgi:hypothetical protein